jgi:hypothetical protein
MKNERLFEVLGSVSPDFVTEAAAAEIPAATPRRRRFRKGIFALAAAMIALITLTVGLTISAEEEPALEEVPVMMLKEDFERLVKTKLDKQVDKRNRPSGLTHEAMRLQAFYEYWDLSQYSSEKSQAALMERFPAIECGPIYVLDETVVDWEVGMAWALEYLRYLGFSQLDLIEAYENLHRAVEESDLEDKEAILETLPEIPPRPVSKADQ